MTAAQSEIERIAFFESTDSIAGAPIDSYSQVYHYDGDHIGSTKLSEDFLNRIDLHTCDHRAGLVIDSIFDKIASGRVAEFFNRHLSSPQGHLYLKQQLLIDLAGLFRSLCLLEKLSAEIGGRTPIDFFPRQFDWQLYRQIADDRQWVPVKPQIPKWYRRRMAFKAWLKKAAFAAFVFLYPLGLIRKMRPLSSGGKRQTFRYGFHVFNSGIHHCTPPYSLNFLINRTTHPEDVLLIAESAISRVNREKIDKADFSCCYMQDIVSHAGLLDFLSLMFKRIVVIQVHFLRLLASGNTTVLRCAAKLVESTISWELFFKLYYVGQLVTFQEPGNILRSLLHKRHQAQTSFIFLNSSYDTLSKQRNDVLMDSVFGFMVYDRMLSSRVSIDYFARNNNLIDRYVDVGVMPADHAYRIRNDCRLRSNLKRRLSIPEEKRVISFFDVSIGREHMFTFEEALELIADMQRLMDDHPEVVCIYKSRAVPHYQNQPAVKAAFESFIHSDRVLFANELNTELTSTHYMGISDLVIGCFASSVGMEAVSGGIPAIYYTPKRFFEFDSIIKAIPHYCACGYRQLKNLTDYWLNAVDDEAWRTFQDGQIKAAIDSYCDGQAQERLTYALIHNC